MRIIEIKSQKVKIQYKPAEDRIAIGDFLDFNEGATGLVAQVYKVYSEDNSGEYNYAELTFLITTKYGKAFPWNGEVVSANANVKKTSVEFIENYINKGDFEEPFALGYCAGTYNQPLRLNFKNFKAPAFVGYEKQADNIAFLKSVAYQLKLCAKKLLVVDYNGNIEIDGALRVTAGFQMKLPLNSEMLESLSSKMTLGVSADAKAVIDEVLIDLAKFAKETGDFIPISRLVNVIDETYKKSKISQLILFKNKLRVYQRQNIFADTISEINYIYDALMGNNTVIFDISNIPPEWRNEFLTKAIYPLENALADYYIYLPIEQDIDNKILNYLLFKAVKNGIKPILALNYRHMAMDNVLDFSANSFLFGTSNALYKREYLSDIIQSLPQDYFVVMGELTSSLIITSYLGEPIDVLDTQVIMEQNKESNEALDIIQNTMEEQQTIAETIEQEVQMPNVDMGVINTALNVSSNSPEISEQTEEVVAESETNEQITETIQDENIIPEVSVAAEETVKNPEIESDTLQEIELEQESVQEPEQEPQLQSEPEAEMISEPVIETEQEPEIETAIEPQNSETEVQEVQLLEPENVSLPQENEFPADEDDILDVDDKLVHRDVLDAPYDYIEEQPAPEPEPQVEDIELDDLDFLEDTQQDPQPYTQNDEDELLDLLSETDEAQEVENMNVDELDFEDVSTDEQQPSSEEAAQKLPVYEAQYENKVPTNTISLQEGDLVKHNKYGLGTVKKLINHGNKVMCFINFEDFGRRLLDPEISQLEKIK